MRASVTAVSTGDSSTDQAGDLLTDPPSGASLSFGKYRLTRLLARGGMGEVYLARLVGELGFEKRLVIKTILPHLAANPRFVELFAAEARTAVALSHGNIVPIYELGRTNDIFYIVMGHVDGPSVATMLEAYRRRGSAPPLGVALHVVRGVLTGLAYAHTAEPGRSAIVHRDITPRNVLVDRSGQVRIVDFGIAAPADAQLDVRGGSSGYMAPEQAMGDPADPRADVFSAGCLLYELITLERAFPKDGVWSAPDLTGVASDVATVLHAALATNPAQRPADAGELLERLGPAFSRHATSFGDTALAAELRQLFPQGWEQVGVPASSGGGSPGSPSGKRPVTQTFATRLTVVTQSPVDRLPATARRRWPLAAAATLIGATATWVAVGRPLDAAPDAPIRVDHRPREPTLADGTPPGHAATPGPSTLPPPEASSVSPPSSDGDPPLATSSTAVPTTQLFRVEPASATITVDGRNVPNTGELELPPAGRATVAVKAPGFVARTFNVDPEHPLPTTVVLRPAKAAGEGFLRVYAATVPWAEVRIDGRKVGTTPTSKVPVGVGTHRVVVTCVPDACAARQVLYQDVVTIKDGELLEIRAH